MIHNRSKPYPIPEHNGQSLYPFSDQNGAKTLPFGATHTYMAYIREYPLYPSNFTSLKWSPLITFDDFRDFPPPPLLSSFSKRIWVVPPLNPSKDFSDPPFWVLSYDRSPLLFSNSASFSTKGINSISFVFTGQDYYAKLHTAGPHGTCEIGGT